MHPLRHRDAVGLPDQAARSRDGLVFRRPLEDLSDDELQAVSARALCLLLDRPVDPAGSLLDVEVVAHEESRLLGGYRALAPRNAAYGSRCGTSRRGLAPPFVGMCCSTRVPTRPTRVATTPRAPFK